MRAVRKIRRIGILAAVFLLSACGGRKAKEADALQAALPERTRTKTEASLWFDQELELSVLMEDSSAQPVINYAPAQQEIHRLTNVRLNYQIIPQSSFTEQESAMLAANNFPDIIKVYAGDLNAYAKTGIFVPLMQYVNEETMPNFYRFWTENEGLMSDRLVDGELYAFPAVLRDEARNGFGVVLRTDLLQKHGLPVPETFDELIDTMAVLKKLYPDSVPYTGRKGTGQLLDTVSYMLGSGAGLYYDRDARNGWGGYVFGPATEEFKEVLRFLNECYERGVLDPEFATTTSEHLQYMITSGKSFMFIDNSGFGQNYTQLLRRQEGMEDAVLQVIPVPENSFGQRRALAYDTVSTERYFAINAKAKRIDDIIRFIDWMYSEEGSNITNYGVEGISFYLDEEGEPQFYEDYIRSVDDTGFSSKYYAVYSQLGITKLNFSLWCTNTKTQFAIQKINGDWDETVEEYWRIVSEDEAYTDPVRAPAMTPEETERAVEILTDLTALVDREVTKYIMGVEPVENWDRIIEKAVEMGAREVEDIYNTAAAR